MATMGSHSATKLTAPAWKKPSAVKKSTRGRGRPTVGQSGKIQDTLIEVALRSFIDRGFEATTMEAIANDAKVARVTVYRRFADKGELFRQVAHLALSRMGQHLGAGLQADGPPEVVLRAMIDRMLQVHLLPDYLGVLRMAIFEAVRFPDIAKAYWGEVDEALTPISAYLDQLQAAGRISVPNIRDAAIQFFTLAVGGVRYLLVRPTNAPGSREHWVDAVYTTFARAWGLDTSHTQELRRKAGRRGRAKSPA